MTEANSPPRTESTATTLVLELMTSILRTADRRGPDSIEIVSILLEDMASHMSLIGEIFNHHSGLQPLLAEEAATGVEGHPEPALRTIVEAVGIEELGSLAVIADGGLVKVRFADSPDDPTNPGTQNFLGAVTALFSADLNERRLAILAYDENQMDTRMRRALFDLFLQLLPTSTVSLPAVIILIIGNESVDYDHHTGPAPSVRYALHGQRLVRRRRWETSQPDILRLVGETDIPFVLFLGAGASSSSGLRLGDQIRDDALARFTADAVGSTFLDLAFRFHEMIEDDGRLLADEEKLSREEFVKRLTLERVLREEFHRIERGQLPETLQKFLAEEEAVLDSPGTSVEAVRSLLGLQSRLLIVTVNFDRLVEHGSGESTKVFVTEDEFEDFPTYLKSYISDGGPVPVLKIHGSIETPESIVATVDRMAEGLPGSLARSLEALATAHESRIPWFYVGYSMRDPDVTLQLQQPSFSKRTDERWIAPLSDPNIEEFVERFRVSPWGKDDVPTSLHEHSYTETADVFLGEVARLLLGA